MPVRILRDSDLKHSVPGPGCVVAGVATRCNGRLLLHRLGASENNQVFSAEPGLRLIYECPALLAIGLGQLLDVFAIGHQVRGVTGI